MATAPPPHTRPRQGRLAAPTAGPRWLRWLLLGLFFGLGYGFTQRLLEVRWGEGTTKAPAFKPKSPPGGTPLEELRRQEGANPKPLPADLEELSRQQQEEKQKAEALKREETERQKAANEAEKARLENDRRRLEEMGSSPEPTPQAVTEPSPAVPMLPPPAPLPAERPSPPPAPTPSEAPATSP